MIVCGDIFSNYITIETVVSLFHKNADSHININMEFDEDDGQIPIDEIARKAEGGSRYNK
jgi:hypothetical protein